MNTQRSQSSNAVRAEATGASQPGFGDAPLTRLTFALIVVGVAGGILFALTYLIEGVTRPGYDGFRQAISALSLGPGGWVQQVNFVIFGALTLLTAVGWRRALAPGAGSIAYPILRTVEGLALIADGFFSQDPAPGYPVGVAPLATPTLHGELHVIFAIIAITAIAVADFVLAWRFAREPRWRGWVAPAIVTGVLTLVFITLFGALTPHFAYDGVMERVATGVNTFFGLAIVIRLFAMQRRASEAHAVGIAPSAV